MARGKNWNMHDDRLLRNLVARGDLSATDIFLRFNQRAIVKRSSGALASHIGDCRFVISDHHGADVGCLPAILRNMQLPAMDIPYTVSPDDEDKTPAVET